MFEFELALQLGKTHAELRRELGGYRELAEWQAFFRIRETEAKQRSKS